MKMLVLFASILVAGCACYPVYERPGYYIPANQIPVGKVCDASGWFCEPVYAAPVYTNLPVVYPYPYGYSQSSLIFYHWRRY